MAAATPTRKSLIAALHPLLLPAGHPIHLHRSGSEARGFWMKVRAFDGSVDMASNAVCANSATQRDPDAPVYCIRGWYLTAEERDALAEEVGWEPEELPFTQADPDAVDHGQYAVLIRADEWQQIVDALAPAKRDT